MTVRVTPLRAGIITPLPHKPFVFAAPNLRIFFPLVLGAPQRMSRALPPFPNSLLKKTRLPLSLFFFVVRRFLSKPGLFPSRFFFFSSPLTSSEIKVVLYSLLSLSLANNLCLHFSNCPSPVLHVPPFCVLLRPGSVLTLFLV